VIKYIQDINKRFVQTEDNKEDSDYSPHTHLTYLTCMSPILMRRNRRKKSRNGRGRSTEMTIVSQVIPRRYKLSRDGRRRTSQRVQCDSQTRNRQHSD
jgi:hypothetical protein